MLALGGAPLSSPKQTTTERQSSLFPYYAGFSEAFVRDVLDALQASSDQVVLDPWNGSGTTTSIAGQSGLQSIGIDINPAMAVVAMARLASQKHLTEARGILTNSGRTLSQRFLIENCSSPYDCSTRSLLLLAVFRIARRKLRDRDRLATNPTWWQVDQAEVRRALASITKIQIDRELNELGSKLSGGRTSAPVSLVRGNLLGPALPQIAADIIITSPPYLTRIDYVKATLPELLVLSLVEDFSIEELRRSMIGTPVIGRGPDSMPVHIGDYGKSLLAKIAAHTSKASATYYLAFFSSYISRMVASFEKLRGLARPGAQMVIVVQGSHYKEIFVDLARLSTDFAGAAGFKLVSRADFNFKQSFAQLNPKANGYGMDTAQETALLFKLV
ncbi:site-specific DNA-methyltransferase [Bradyrhizobium sp. CNPSo 4010]|uniref:Methyltransferase n=1 Tax=Bradyrhizobium agreste TaxID=2751811 RepID=A0ABS0PMV9_9BRAD|nr:DNA methyltransferase [Bradyrhizobium agreste]MBH5398440.1 site-specific DNA-methyltransferase [Bradyrhizobium agreste]